MEYSFALGAVNLISDCLYPICVNCFGVERCNVRYHMEYYIMVKTVDY